MLISMLKYKKAFKGTPTFSILTDHHQGVVLYLVKFTE